MKMYLSLVLGTVLILSFIGCKSSSSTVEENEVTYEETNVVTVETTAKKKI